MIALPPPPITSAIVAPYATLKLPVGARILSVTARGQRIALRRFYDGQPDGCKRQWSYTGPRSKLILAEYVDCWGPELQNWTRSRLTVRIQTARVVARTYTLR